MGSTPPYITDAGARASGALLKLQTHGASPPVNAYLYPGSQMRIELFSSVAGTTVVLNYLILLPDGRLVQNNATMVTTGTRASQVTALPLPEGFLIQMAARSFGNNHPNQYYIKASILATPGNTQTNFQTFLEGYMTTGGTLWWPGGPNLMMGEGAGAIMSVTGTTPGAGAEVSQTVPTNSVWEFKSLIVTFTASAAVANRVPHLIIDDGVNVLLNLPLPAAITAGLTRTLNAADNMTAFALTDGVASWSFPAAIRLITGFRIRTLTTALDAGDQYGTPQFGVTEWLDF